MRLQASAWLQPDDKGFAVAPMQQHQLPRLSSIYVIFRCCAATSSRWSRASPDRCHPCPLILPRWQPRAADMLP